MSMDIPQEQIEELKRTLGSVQLGMEGGYTFFLIPSLQLPDGCKPKIVDALLCPMPRDGYPSRLFFSEAIKTPTPRNWNTQNVRILERNWWAFSWKLGHSDLRLIQIISAHLRGLR